MRRNISLIEKLLCKQACLSTTNSSMSLGTRSLKKSNGDLSLIFSIDLPMKSGIECVLDMPLDACAETGVALEIEEELDMDNKLGPVLEQGVGSPTSEE